MAVSEFTEFNELSKGGMDTRDVLSSNRYIPRWSKKKRFFITTSEWVSIQCGSWQ